MASSRTESKIKSKSNSKSKSRAHLLGGISSEFEGRNTSEQFEGSNPKRPHVLRRFRANLPVAAVHRVHHLRRRVAQAEAHVGGAAGAGDAPKVDDRPAVLARQPQEIGGFQVAVHIPCPVQMHQPLADVCEDLQNVTSYYVTMTTRYVTLAITYNHPQHNRHSHAIEATTPAM